MRLFRTKVLVVFQCKDLLKEIKQGVLVVYTELESYLFLVGVPSVTFFSCWFAGGIPGGFVFLPISGTTSLLSLIMFLQQRDSSYLIPVPLKGVW